MKHLLSFVIILINIGIIQAQKQDLKKYYQEVAKAENCLINNNYAKAVKHYKKAFQNKDWVFIDDLFNAVFCEVKTGKPTKENCQYFSQLAQGRMNFRYFYSDFENVDTNLFVKFIKTTDSLSYVSDFLSEIKEADQKVRKNYDNLNMTQIRTTDSLNIIKFKEFMKTTDLFDDKIISIKYLNYLFIHWFTAFPGEQNYFIPLMVEAVKTGKMNANDFVYTADAGFWRKNPQDAFSPYGTSILTIYSTCNKQPENSTDTLLAMFRFDVKSKITKQYIKEINVKRKEVFLDDCKKSSIRNFNLWLKKMGNKEYRPLIRARSQSVFCTNKEIDILAETKLTIPNLQYFFVNGINY
jgi:hypothetical protein